MESADDLAAFFVSGEFATAAILRPEKGAARPVTVLLNLPEKPLSVGQFGGVYDRAYTALIRGSDVAGETLRGAHLAVGPDTYRVKKAAELDSSASIFRLDLDPNLIPDSQRLT